MDDDYIIHAVQFRPDGFIEISFAQEHEEVERAALLRTVIFEPTLFTKEMEALRSDLSDLITEVCVYLRNPDARKEEERPEPEEEVDEPGLPEL